jgi:hypothetical protein
MNTATLAALGALTALTIAGCSGGAQQKAAPPAAGAFAEFGVKECDDYLNAVVACVDSKVPEAARAMLRQSLEQSKAAWKQAASTPQGKASLAGACQQARQAARASYAAYGCTL